MGVEWCSMDSAKNLTSISQAEDVRNLLDHIAWRETIKPKLDDLRRQWGKALVAALLSDQPHQQAVRLAARIEAFDFVEDFFTRILREGERAAIEMIMKSERK